MSVLGSNFQPLKCPDCKKVVIRLVPISPKDQQHTGKMTCRKCKKKYLKKKRKLLADAKSDEKL